MPMLVEVFTRRDIPFPFIFVRRQCHLKPEILHLLWHAPPSSHKSLSNNSGNDGSFQTEPPFLQQILFSLQCEQCIKSWPIKISTQRPRHTPNEGSYWNLNPLQEHPSSRISLIPSQRKAFIFKGAKKIYIHTISWLPLK